MYTFDEIVAIIRLRQEQQSPLLKRMMEIRERYNGDYVMLAKVQSQMAETYYN
jgi:hypothetical protein